MDASTWNDAQLTVFAQRSNPPSVVEQLENNQEYDAAQGERERETARERRVSESIDHVGVPAPVVRAGVRVAA